MKNIFALVLTALGALSFTPSAALADVNATIPTAGAVSVIPGGTNNIAAASTNVYGLTQFTFSVSDADNVGIQIEVKPVSAPAALALVFFRIARSIDGVNYDTNTPAIAAPLNASTGVATLSTNLDTRGLASFRVVDCWNTNAMAITNVTVKVRPKSTGIVVRAR